MILHKANLTDFTKNTVRTSKFSRVIDTKSLCHFYTLIMNSQKGILKKFSFTTSSKRIKYLGVNLIKEVKNLYIKNYMMLMKEPYIYTRNNISPANFGVCNSKKKSAFS